MPSSLLSTTCGCAAAAKVPSRKSVSSLAVRFSSSSCSRALKADVIEQRSSTSLIWKRRLWTCALSWSSLAEIWRPVNYETTRRQHDRALLCRLTVPFRRRSSLHLPACLHQCRQRPCRQYPSCSHLTTTRMAQHQRATASSSQPPPHQLPAMLRSDAAVLEVDPPSQLGLRTILNRSERVAGVTPPCHRAALLASPFHLHLDRLPALDGQVTTALCNEEEEGSMEERRRCSEFKRAYSASLGLSSRDETPKRFP